MVKKVRFSDKVEVRYMDVNLKEHSREVKNPIGYQESMAKMRSMKGGILPTKSLGFISCMPSWVWWGLLIILIIVIIYFIRKYYFSDKSSSKESLEKTS